MHVNKIQQPLVFALVVMILAGCNRQQAPSEEEVKVKVPVTVTGVQITEMSEYLEFTATSRFLNKSVISAPATGYIREVYYNAGENVIKGQDLFTLQTKEAAALSNDSLSRLNFPGLIRVKAAIDGMIVSINHPKGDFVIEGDPWGTISVPSSLVFILEAPFETSSLIKINSLCQIKLPDGNSIPARISSRLPSMSEGTQTQQFIVQPGSLKDIPENLIAKIRVVKKTVPAAITLPKACILADEVMEHYWVMKVVNDSTAVRVNVLTGLAEGNNIEITDPVFLKDDLFLASGNYGLADTVSVYVAGKMR